MAFQPFQLSNSSPVLDGLDGIGNALVQASQMRRQRDQQALENLRTAGQDKRQAQGDYQSTLMKARELASKGDMQGAQALMAQYGAQQQQREAPEDKPWSANLNQSEVGFADKLGDMFTPEQIAGTGQPSPAPVDPSQIQPPPFQPQGAPAAAPPTNPLVAAAQADQAKQKRMASFLTGVGPDGQKWTLDPEAQRYEQQGRADEAFAKAGGEEGDTGDIVRELYPQMRAAAQAGGSPLDANETMKYIQGEAKTRSAETRADARQTASDAAADRRYKQHMDDQAHADEEHQKNRDAAMARAGIIAQPGLKIDTANRGDTNSLEKGVRDYFAAGDGKTLLKGNRTLHAAMANIGAKGPDAVMAHKDSFLALERYSRGGTPTDSETHLFLNNMGGIPGALERFYAEAKTGDFSPITQQNIARASQISLKENDENVGNFIEGAKSKFGPGSSWSNMGPQVNREMRAMGKLYGVDVPDLYSEGEGQNQGAVLGSGKRPTPSKGKAPHPLVQAAQTSGMPAEMSAWVRANPGPKADAIVAKWKKDNGVRP